MKKLSLGIFAALALSAVALPLSTPARADDDAREFREKVMKTQGKSMKTLAGYLKGEETSAEDLMKAAAALAETAATDPKKVFFPPDAKPGVGDSHVKPALWTEWPKAQEYWNNFVTASGGLTVAVATGDKAKIGPAVKAVGETCKTCHESYRIKKEE